MKAFFWGYITTFAMVIVPILVQEIFNYRPAFGQIGWMVLGGLFGVGTGFLVAYLKIG